MPVQVELQYAPHLEKKRVFPSLAQYTQWVQCAIAPRKHAKVCIRLVDISEMHSLNHQYRHKDKPTNVLSFPSQLPKTLARGHLGDLVLCPPVILKEASTYQKSIEAYFAHLVIHGILHLLGYDHIKISDALIMERLETHLITSLGYPPPYGALDD